MNQSFKDLITRLIELLAKLATPALERQLSRLATHLNSDVPQLEAAWVARFRDPLGAGESQVLAIDATLSQFGRRLHGIAHIQGHPGDLFDFQGFIKRNVFYGSFHRRDAHILAGTGTFILKIHADSHSMKGHCTWYDSLLDDVWHSEYEWNRSG